MRVSTRDVRNDPDDFREGVRDPATGNLLGGAASFHGSLTYFLRAHDRAAANLLRGTHDLITVSLPVRTIGSVADNVADAF